MDDQHPLDGAAGMLVCQRPGLALDLAFDGAADGLPGRLDLADRQDVVGAVEQQIDLGTGPIEPRRSEEGSCGVVDAREPEDLRDAKAVVQADLFEGATPPVLVSTCLADARE